MYALHKSNFFYAFTVKTLNELTAPNKDFSLFAMPDYSNDSSLHERIYTWIEGIKLGTHNLLLGNGLGYFVHNEILKFNRPLIIHNSAIWIFCELGIVGLIIFATIGIEWLKFSIKQTILAVKNKLSLSEQKTIIIGLFIIFIVMSQAHEMLYQRLFWFILGLAAIDAGIKFKKSKLHNSQ